MELQLTPPAARVLGCLIEKEMATPEYYPLTLNALISACNQKSNREPVMTLGEDDVLQALDELRQERMSYKSSEGVRAVRYCHNLQGLLKLEEEELAVLAVLLLRGPQTIGELRTRCERLHNFADLQAVETVLQGLIERESPLVVKLPLQPGRKEQRYAQLFCAEAPAAPGAEEAVAAELGPGRHDRLLRLEEEVALLREELRVLGETFNTFRSQFE